MNFKIGRFFFLFFSLLFSVFFLLVGTIGVMIPWSPWIRSEIVQFVLEDSLFFPVFGASLILVGLSFLIYTFFSLKKRYIIVKSGTHSIKVDENVIQNYLETYWQEQFPHSLIPAELKIKKGIIQITADFPFLPQSEQREFLEKIKNDFQYIFHKLLGCTQEIRLIASFQSKP